MLIAASALAFLSASVLGPQAHFRGPARWNFEPFARQLGAVHFPGGEAALDERITGVEVLPSGAAIVAGYTFGSLGEAHAGPSSTPDIFVARFGVLGNLEWITQIGAVTGPTIPALNGAPLGPGGDATGSDSAWDVAVAPDGSIFITGLTSGSLGETEASVYPDFFVAKLDPAGTLVWLRQIGAQTGPTIPPEPGATQWGDASGYDIANSILVHPSGDLLVGGSTSSALSENPYDEDFFLARFDGSGVLRWVRQLSTISGPSIGFSPDMTEECDSIALHPSGRIVLAGTGWEATGTLLVEGARVFLFDDAGHPLAWTGLGSSKRLDGLAIHAPTGQILFGGGVFDWFDQPLPSDAFAACYDANLTLLWAVRVDASTTSHLGLQDLGSSEYVSSVVLDAAGNLVLAGSTGGSLNEPQGGNVDFFTARIRRTDGFVLSMDQIGQTTAAAMGFRVDNGEIAGVNGLALGPAGTLYLGGSTSSRLGEARGGLSDALLLRLDAHGRLR